MGNIDYIFNRLKETLRYFKGRTKKKYEGDRFEEWVVSHSNIRKNPKNTQQQNSNGTKTGNPRWELLEWRGDKYVAGWHALSNCPPDLILKEIGKETEARTIAVECKYREEINFQLEKEDVVKYEKYLAEREPEVKMLYYVFGFNWDESKNKPEKIYRIPSEKIYNVIKKEGNEIEIKFHEEIKNMDYFKQFKVKFDGGINRYIMYSKPDSESKRHS